MHVRIYSRTGCGHSDITTIHEPKLFIIIRIVRLDRHNSTTVSAESKMTLFVRPAARIRIDHRDLGRVNVYWLL